MTQQSAVEAVRSSHDILVNLFGALGVDELTRPSAAVGWSVAQVASHLGSQAEIFDRFLDAGADGGSAPGGDDFRAIWARWDAMGPDEQVSSSASANAGLVNRLEQLARDGDGFSVEMFGDTRDVEGVALLRLGEHALHTWDVAAALDPAATISPDAVPVVLDLLPGIAARSGRPADAVDAGDDAADAVPSSLVVRGTDPERTFRLTTSPDVRLEPETGGASADVVLPSEALVRLVYGRLAEEHTPDGIIGAEHLPGLRQVFPGF